MIVLNQIQVIIDNDEVGFNFACKDKNTILFWKIETLPTDLLKILKQRLKEDMNKIVTSAVDLTKEENQFNTVVDKVLSEENNG